MQEAEEDEEDMEDEQDEEGGEEEEAEGDDGDNAATQVKKISMRYFLFNKINIYMSLSYEYVEVISKLLCDQIIGSRRTCGKC